MKHLSVDLGVTVYPARPALPGAPAPRTLLLAHGYGCDQGMWHALLPLLAQHRCITFNQPGAGAGNPAAYDPHHHATLQGYAATLLDLVAELAEPDLVYVGHSVSAMIGALAAVQVPGAFSQLVMLCPSPCYLNDLPHYPGGFTAEQLDGLLQGLADGHQAWSQAMAPVIMANPDQPALTTDLAARFCAMDPLIALRWARATFLTDLRPVVPQVTVPTLVLHCREDAIAGPAVGEWVASKLPEGQLLWLEASGHCPQLSHPAEVARVLLAGLKTPVTA